MINDFEIINNIEKASEFCEREFSHEELTEILQGENDIEKQICILKIDELKSQKDADLLVFHLTNHHGIVRESTAIKLSELIKEYTDFFQTEYIADSLLKSVNDVNPNICRLMTAVLPYLNKKEYFIKNLYARFEVIFKELEKLKRSNMYTKKLFNLYWCIEALSAIQAPLDKRMETLLEKTHRFKDYTIREKTAMLVSQLVQSSGVIENIKNTLKNDSNFYVRRYVE
jgi:uncharacterized membrane protein YheB (UPF0754 family)